MHPAKSVIGFTTLSGAGYGLAIWLVIFVQLGLLDITPLFALAGMVLALAMVTVGLLFSLAHLGHPKRAWRAYSQWRTSWLSREGVLASFSYAPLMAWAILHMGNEGYSVAGQLTAFVSVGISIATLYATSMIYRTLKPIPAWHNGYVVPAYLLLGLTTGGVLLLTILPSELVSNTVQKIILLGIFLSLLIKILYWRMMAGKAPTATIEDATGLGHLGKVKQFESAHSEENYLLKEMGFRIGRKHSDRLKSLFKLCFVVGSLSLFAGFSAIAMVAVALGVLAERWLFFAEAKHSVQLYYGEQSI